MNWPEEQTFNSTCKNVEGRKGRAMDSHKEIDCKNLKIQAVKLILEFNCSVAKLNKKTKLLK